MPRPPAEFPARRRRDTLLLDFAAVILVWCAVVSAVVAGGVALLTSFGSWPAGL